MCFRVYPSCERVSTFLRVSPLIVPAIDWRRVLLWEHIYRPRVVDLLTLIFCPSSARARRSPLW